MMAARQFTDIRGILRQDESMARHVSWRAGGRADWFFVPADLDDLAGFLGQLPAGEPLLWVGLGSNLLVRDGGFRGTVIACSNLKRLQPRDSDRLHVQCGVPCAKVARHAAARGLVGGEFLAGIPGVMGGALAMNAGAFGGETWDLVDGVEVMDRSGVVVRRRPEEFDVAYRQVVSGREEWFVGAVLRFRRGDAQQSAARIKSLLDKRAQTQPMGQASCGSVFRNPPGGYAARLIEACGLKGHRIGGAVISPKHANFIVNQNQASAQDIEALIEFAADTVYERMGVRLIPEVRIVGEPVPRRGR